MRNPFVRFEDILDDCITAIQERGESVADCLVRYPAQREELEPLLRLTIRLQAARTLQAPPEFRRVSTIRVRNVIAARPHRVERVGAKPNPLRYIQRRLQALFGTQRRLPAIATISVVLAIWLLVGGGTVYASAGALPGDALYPVKRAVEAVQLAVSLNDASDAMLHLAFAARRLDEAAALLKEERLQDIGQALTDYEAQVGSVLAFFDEDSDLSPDEQALLADLLATAQAHHEARLTLLLDQVPGAARPAIELALTASRAARDQALEVVGGRPGRPEDLPEPPVDVLTVPPEASPQPPTEVTAPTTVPTQPPTPTPLPEPPTSIPSPEPSIPVPSPERPEWPTPSGWPTPPETPEWPTPS
nr:hypothetical protein [Anaerolineae bacterium]